MTETLKKYFKGDAVVWSVIVALSIISLLAVYSSTGTLAYKSAHGNTTYYGIPDGKLVEHRNYREELIVKIHRLSNLFSVWHKAKLCGRPRLLTARC